MLNHKLIGKKIKCSECNNDIIITEDGISHTCYNYQIIIPLFKLEDNYESGNNITTNKIQQRG